MSFEWRQENPILTPDRKIIKGGMWKHQRDWWNSSGFIKLLVTGYGGGKTLIGGKRAISMALHNAPVPYMCVSPTYDLAMTTTVPTISALLDGRKIPYHYNVSKKLFTIRYTNEKGQTYPAFIWVRSGENPKRLKGSNLCGAWIDEPFIQDKEVFMQMLARIRDPESKHMELNLTGTPEDLNWGYDISEGDESENYPDLHLIRASTRDNLALPERYIETLTNAYDEKLIDAYMDGKFVNLSTGPIYYNFNRERNVLVDKDMEKGPFYLGMDFNVDPMAAVVFTVKGERIHYIREFELPNSDTEQMIEHAQEEMKGKIVGAYPDPSGKARKTSAPAGRTDFTIIKNAGIKVNARKKAPGVRDRRNAVNRKFKDNTATIDPRCKKLIRYTEQLTHAKLKKQEEMTHLRDAADYPCEFIFPIKRPKLEVNIDVY